MKELATEKTMTIKEVAEVLSVSRSQVEKTVREIFPDKMRNGVTTYLTNVEATEIKKHIQVNPYLGQLSEVTSDIEMSEMTVKVLQFHIQKSQRLEAENKALVIERQIMLPKVETAEALTRCDTNMCISNAAKHFGLHPKTQVYAYLRVKGYLTSKDLPSQEAINADILELRQNKCNDNEFRPQAVVGVNQLEKWRTWLVPKIIEWSEEVPA